MPHSLLTSVLNVLHSDRDSSAGCIDNCTIHNQKSLHLLSFCFHCIACLRCTLLVSSSCFMILRKPINWIRLIVNMPLDHKAYNSDANFIAYFISFT